MSGEREKEQFVRFLRRRGLRQTAERQAVFEEIYRQHGHIDAEELLAGLKAAGRSVSRATVYRNLELLVEAGLVSKQRLGRNKNLYEHLHPGQSHDHLVCTECGRVAEFVSPAIGAMLGEILRAHGFSRDHRKIQIAGLCQGCREALESTAAAASEDLPITATPTADAAAAAGGAI